MAAIAAQQSAQIELIKSQQKEKEIPASQMQMRTISPLFTTQLAAKNNLDKKQTKKVENLIKPVEKLIKPVEKSIKPIEKQVQTPKSVLMDTRTHKKQVEQTYNNVKQVESMIQKFINPENEMENLNSIEINHLAQNQSNSSLAAVKGPKIDTNAPPEGQATAASWDSAGAKLYSQKSPVGAKLYAQKKEPVPKLNTNAPV